MSDFWGTEGVLREYICSDSVDRSPGKSYGHKGSLSCLALSRNRVPVTSLKVEVRETGKRGKGFRTGTGATLGN